MHNIANRKERIDMTNRGKVILNIFVVGALFLTILVTGGFVKETCQVYYNWSSDKRNRRSMVSK